MIDSEKVADWQPIETAPFDVEVLIAGEGQVLTAQQWEFAPGWVLSCGGRDLDDGPIEISHSWTPSFVPTHWMPLPAPPS